ncbi:MAG: hypothetical protein J7L25_12030 [Deltaproteobacteria bacterium]|nr:hypothetical protein [Candidatus Tharpella aukensis]
MNRKKHNHHEEYEERDENLRGLRILRGEIKSFLGGRGHNPDFPKEIGIAHLEFMG